MIEKLRQMMEEAKQKMDRAASLADAEELRVKYLGKKGELTEILRSMGSLPPEERKTLGQAANSARSQLEQLLNENMERFRQMEKAAELSAETIDVTEPGRGIPIGAKHLLTITTDEIIRVFSGMGFSVSEGPEVETVFNNFDALNSPPNHPSRDMT
ncbi:MAG: phenylalanine--tRNA ligase subunit alpha, partial [Eubacteriales bacterium]|nr:phenylalanine--tRNA ligase subunit alpha [Eubacteriales bacterium]